MDRTDETIVLDAAPWLTDPAAQAVCTALGADGHQVFFVGGCVRNALLGELVNDVDLATSATPDKVVALAGAAGLKVVPTGIDHGTITVVADRTPFEVTTFRRDVETDGRRAVVAYSDDIADDARRRDFTINALYAAHDGRVFDPLGGLADLRARRIRFIEDPDARIQEDYLRILRFFRFHAWYGRASEGFDADALSSISANSAGLETLSAERIGAEMKKLLSARDPAQAISGMRQTGVLRIILPGADDRMLAPVVHLEESLSLTLDWRLRLVALGGEDVADRLRLSKADARHLDLLKRVGFAGPSLPEIAYRHGEAAALQSLCLRCAMSDQPPSASDLADIRNAATKRFPITAGDLMPTYAGPALGARLAGLEQAWIASGFMLERAALMDLPDE